MRGDLDFDDVDCVKRTGTWKGWHEWGRGFRSRIWCWVVVAAWL